MRVCMCFCVFKIFSETIGPTEAEFHEEPQWDRGRKFIQMIPVICCSSFEYCQPLGAGAFRRAFTTNVAPQSSAFSRALEIEKLKATLFPALRGPGIQMTGALLLGLPRKSTSLFWFLVLFFCLTSKSTIFSHFGIEPPLPEYLSVLGEP